MKKVIIFLILIPFFTSCEDVFTPEVENIRSLDAMYAEPSFAQGILANAYILLPYSSNPGTDVATDDAVSNDNANSYLKMATGSWTSNFNPTSQWQDRKNAIQYINIFIDNVDKVVWAKDEKINMLYKDRLKGEAYGLRALQMYYLIMSHGGWTDDGRLLGVPIINSPETAASNFNVPRNTFQKCVDQIFSDADKAIELLPLNFGDVVDAKIPDKYKALGITYASDYNRVNGGIMLGRITGRIVEAIKSQVALLAASPAYSSGTTVTWANAADYAAIVIDRINGPSGLQTKGGTWYSNITEINGLGSGANPAEIIWRGDVSQDYSLEENNFPSSLYGKGRINPTQNLVDAFPTLTGYPIKHLSSGYLDVTPYVKRDPRLTKYILIDGGKQGPSSTVITTGTYGTNKDGLNKENGLSTKTGYYLLKLLRSDCNPNPQFKTKQKHYVARIRYTEIFLNYAEAANEAWGPTGTGTNAYSAYDVIKAIRVRAGITGGDAYLESIKSDKDLMRELIRTERRIELCFENKRFWDLRRWKANLNEKINGMKIDKLSDGKLSYTIVDVEVRDYKDYMYFGPIPYGEVQKWSLLEQNAGW